MRNCENNGLSALAERYIMKYREVCGPGGLTRVDPFVFSSRVTGLKIVRSVCPRPGVPGLSVLSGGALTVTLPGGGELSYGGGTAVIDSRLFEMCDKGRLNFTVMHENAHLIFEKARREGFCLPPEREEAYADALASRLLLPREAVDNSMRILGLPKGTVWLNGGPPGSFRRGFDLMRRHLGVSETALKIRLCALGYITEKKRAAIDVF